MVGCWTASNSWWESVRLFHLGCSTRHLSSSSRWWEFARFSYESEWENKYWSDETLQTMQVKREHEAGCHFVALIKYLQTTWIIMHICTSESFYGEREVLWKWNINAALFMVCVCDAVVLVCLCGMTIQITATCGYGKIRSAPAWDDVCCCFIWLSYILYSCSVFWSSPDPANTRWQHSWFSTRPVLRHWLGVSWALNWPTKTGQLEDWKTGLSFIFYCDIRMVGTVFAWWTAWHNWIT